MSSNIWCTPWLTDFTPLHRLRRVRRYRHRILPRLHRGHLEAADLWCLRAAWELRQRAEPWHHPAPAAGSQMKNCTPLWREARFEVKMYKTHQNTPFSDHFWKWRRQKKVHTVVARRKNSSQNVQCTAFSDHFWKLRRQKKCTPLWHEAHPRQNVKNTTCSDNFGRSDVVLLGRRKGLCTLSQRAKREGFLAFPKTMAGVGHVKRTWKDPFSVAGAIQETCSSEMLGGPGADILRGIAFWSIRSSVLGRWFCVTGAALRMTLASFSRQAVVNFENWGSVAE